MGVPSSDVIVLESDDDNREPTEEEVIEYAEYLGIDPKEEAHLLWIAREGVVAPIPPPWKACTENGDNVFYFNFESGESLWDHPCDEKYRELVEEERAKRSSSLRNSSQTAEKTDGALDGSKNEGKHEDLGPDKNVTSSATSSSSKDQAIDPTSSEPTVGSRVIAKGREGEVTGHDPEDPNLTYKVLFADGTADWFPRGVVQMSPKVETLDDAPCSITPTPKISQLKDEDETSSEDQTCRKKHSVPTITLTEPEKHTEEGQNAVNDVEGDSRRSSPTQSRSPPTSLRQVGKLTIPPLHPRALERTSPKSSPRLERGQTSPGGSRSGKQESSSGRSDGGRSEGLSSELSEEFDFAGYPSELQSRHGSVFNRRDSLAYSEVDTPLGDTMDSFISFHFDSERRGSMMDEIPEHVEESVVCSESEGGRLRKVHDDLASLARTLSKLREIRGHQVEYLQFLRNGRK